MSEPVLLGRGPSLTWTFHDGVWTQGNLAIMGVRTHAAWQGSSVFDGARWFEGVGPDLDQHFARVNRSAAAMGLLATVEVETWLGLAREGVAKFPKDAALYVRPMYWPEGGIGGGVMVEPETTRWCLTLYEAPLPPPIGAAITLSPFRKPRADMAPSDAKAGCLYPNNARALREAAARGFSNCLMRDEEGRIAELANANIMMARGGTLFTPRPTGTFLNGVTRRRVTALLRAAGTQVVETDLSYEDFLAAEEIFSCGNFLKVSPVRRIEDRTLEAGPLYTLARRLYWDYAHSAPVSGALELA
jgi:branched-chain amino acid aminotransferase